MNSKANELMTPEEACAQLGCSPNNEPDDLSSVIQQGFLDPIRLGDRMLFHRSEVERVAEMFRLGRDMEVTK